jgi:hypothetical protein
MPPKNTKKTVGQNDSGDEETSLKDMMRVMSAQLTSLTSEVKDLKTLICDLKNENAQLKAEAKVTEQKLCDMNTKNISLENRLNTLEQYNRSWSARVLNIPLSGEEETNNQAVASKVYSLLLKPILEGAVEKGIITTVPPIEQVLELAHVLPGKAGHPKPIIMRFLNRNLRDTVFQLKKFYSPREGNGGAGGGAGRRGAWGGGAGPVGRGADTEREEGGFEGRGRYLYPLYEDLSRASFQKMRAIANDSRTKACWSVKGQIKFTLVRNPSEVKRVVSLLDPLDDILK